MEILKKYLPLGIFCLYFGKVYFQTISFPEVGILLILAGLASFFEYKSNDSKLVSLQEKFDKSKLQFEEILNKQQIQLDSQLKDFEIIKTGMASLKLSTGFRQVNNK